MDIWMTSLYSGFQKFYPEPKFYTSVPQEMVPFNKSPVEEVYKLLMRLQDRPKPGASNR